MAKFDLEQWVDSIVNDKSLTDQEAIARIRVAREMVLIKKAFSVPGKASTVGERNRAGTCVC